MKKFLLVLAAVCCVATVSAKKSVVETVKDSKWSVGLRAGNGLQAQAEMFLNKTNYVELRFGLGTGANFQGLCIHSASADFTALFNWNCKNWNWTPKFATWFLDAGCGFNIGGSDMVMYSGLAGQVKFGLKFKKVPIRLAIDYTPVFGIQHHFGKYYTYSSYCYDNAYSRKTAFFGNGLANAAVSATWCF